MLLEHFNGSRYILLDVGFPKQAYPYFAKLECQEEITLVRPHKKPEYLSPETYDL